MQVSSSVWTSQRNPAGFVQCLSARAWKLSLASSHWPQVNLSVTIQVSTLGENICLVVLRRSSNYFTKWLKTSVTETGGCGCIEVCREHWDISDRKQVECADAGHVIIVAKHLAYALHGLLSRYERMPGQQR